MARETYEAALRNETGNNNRVEFFSLKEDGDEAIVRIMHDSVESFDIVTTHQIFNDGKYAGRVDCLRTSNDPISACPLCAKGEKAEHRFYIHLLQYTRDDAGNIVATPKVWERSLMYAKELRNLITDYGPLSQCLFKIRRNGARGDMKTTYSITICMPQQYPADMYPVSTENAELFRTYTAVGNAVMERSFDDLFTYATTGAMPQVNTEESVNIVTTYANTPPQGAQPTVQGVQPQPTSAVDNQFVTGTMTTAVPNQPMAGVQQVQVNRPIRTY